MDARGVVLMTDHSSTEGSRATLSTAVKMLTGQPPVLIDARHFLPGGGGRANVADGALQLEVPGKDLVVVPTVLLIYEIPPAKRRGFEAFQRLARRYGAISLGTDADAWRTATEKDLMVEQFVLDDIPHMETISLSRPSQELAVAAFDRLGQDVWARPAVGMGGNDVFHITTHAQLRDATRHYASSESDWLMARDATNFTPAGHGNARHRSRRHTAARAWSWCRAHRWARRSGVSIAHPRAGMTLSQIYSGSRNSAVKWAPEEFPSSLLGARRRPYRRLLAAG